MVRSALLSLAVAAAAVGLAARPAAAQSVEQVNLGDTVTGTTVAGVKEVIPFHAVEGTLLDVDLKMAAGSAPDFVILQPDRSPYPGLASYERFDAKSSRVQAKKVPLFDSGRHYLVLQPGVEGAYTVRIKGKPLTRTGYNGIILPAPPTPVPFGAVPGTLASISVKRSKGSFINPQVIYLQAPSGALVDLGAATSHRLTVSAESYKDVPLGELGTYVAGVGTQTGVGGDFGVITVSLKMPKPKPVKRLDSGVVVDPLVDSVAPASGFDNLAYAGISVTGDFFGPSPSVRLEGAETIDASSVNRVSATLLEIDVDLTGRPVGGYDVVVTLPDGAEGRRAGGFAVSATPIPSGASPPTGFDNLVLSGTVSGTRFVSGLSVTFLPRTGGAGIGATEGAVTATSAAVTVDLRDAPLGGYDVLVVNPDGGTNVLSSGFTLLRAPRLFSALPALGFDNDAARAVTLAGDSFQAGMTCRIERSGQADVVAAVSGLTPTGATATFDLRGKLSGPWTLRVTSPDGGTATVAYSIARAPRVFSTNPPHVFDFESLTGVVVNGTDFTAGAQVDLTQGGVSILAATAEAVNGPGTTVTCDLATTGLPPGDSFARVTNPDGGNETLPLPFSVLGTRTLVSGATGAGTPVAAYNGTQDEYLVVWSHDDGTNRNIRARRVSAMSGAFLGSVIVVTDNSIDMDGDTYTATEDKTDPGVAWSPGLGKYLVAYAWKDASTAGDRTKVYAQLVNADGTIHTPQSQAYPAFTGSSGTVSPPRIAWNPTRSEWMVVWAWDVAAGPDVFHLRLDNQVSPMGVVSAGTLIANTHVNSGNTVDDKDADPDVAYSATGAEYAVVYTYDSVEVPGQGGGPPPADTGTDIRAKFFRASDLVEVGSLTTLGDAGSVSESAGRIDYDPIADNWLFLWEYPTSASDHDLRAWRVSRSTRAKVGASFTTVEQTTTKNSRRAALAFDATTATRGWLVAYEYDGNQSVVVTRMSPDLATRTHRAVAPVLSNASFATPALAARGIGGEFLSAWSVSGSAKPGVNAEMRPAK